MTKFVCISLFCFVLFSCNNTQDKILPTERDLVESVYASVTIQPDSLYQVYAIVAGILDQNLVEEGTRVHKDQALIQIINNTPKLNSDNAKLTLQLAQQNYNGSSAILKGIKDQIHAVELKYKNDSLNYFRQKKLWDQNIGSKVTYDTKKLNYELSQNSLRLLHNTYNRTQNELRTALIQAQNNYQSTLINTRDFTVKSKINGKVYALFKEPGEIVNTMEPIAVIGSETNFIIELLIDEVDIVRLQKGQELVIKLDAYANQVFKGHISKIYPKKDERNQTFKVEATFIQAPDVLYPGLSGEGNIIIATKEKVLTIPVAYLMDGNQVKTDNGFITVTTGLQNMEYVEIQSGLSKGTYIYKPE